MNVEQYKKHAAVQEDWAPGWEAIDRELDGLPKTNTCTLWDRIT